MYYCRAFFRSHILTSGNNAASGYGSHIHTLKGKKEQHFFPFKISFHPSSHPVSYFLSRPRNISNPLPSPDTEIAAAIIFFSQAWRTTDKAREISKEVPRAELELMVAEIDGENWLVQPPFVGLTDSTYRIISVSSVDFRRVWEGFLRYCKHCGSAVAWQTVCLPSVRGQGPERLSEPVHRPSGLWSSASGYSVMKLSLVWH